MLSLFAAFIAALVGAALTLLTILLLLTTRLLGPLIRILRRPPSSDVLNRVEELPLRPPSVPNENPEVKRLQEYSAQLMREHEAEKQRQLEQYEASRFTMDGPDTANPWHKAIHGEPKPTPTSLSHEEYRRLYVTPYVRPGRYESKNIYEMRAEAHANYERRQREMQAAQQPVQYDELIDVEIIDERGRVIRQGVRRRVYR